MSSSPFLTLPTHHLARFLRALVAMRRRPLDPEWAGGPTGNKSSAGPRGPARLTIRGPMWLPWWDGTYLTDRITEPEHAQATPFPLGDRTVVRPVCRATQPALSPEHVEDLLTQRDVFQILPLYVDTLGFNPLVPGMLLGEHLDRARLHGFTHEPQRPVCFWVARHHGTRGRGNYIRPEEWHLVVFDLGADESVTVGQAITGTSIDVVNDFARSYPGVLDVPLGEWTPPMWPRPHTPEAAPRSLAEAAARLLHRAGDMVESRQPAGSRDPLVLALRTLLDAADAADNSDSDPSSSTLTKDD